MTAPDQRKTPKFMCIRRDPNKPCYIGHWRVPEWLYDLAPNWVHRAAAMFIRAGR